MIYNKQFGLDFLERAFAGKSGIGLLPYARFDRPEDFDPAAYRDFARVLVRTNVEGDVAWDEYCHLPRGEIRDGDAGKIPELLRTLLGYWRRRRGSRRRPLHFLVHGVGRRSDVLFEGTFRPAGRDVALEMGRPDPKQLVWGLDYAPVKHVTGDGAAALAAKLERAGVRRGESVRLARRLEESASLIVRRIAYEGRGPLSPRWAASFSIDAARPDRPVFFRFLFEGGKAPEAPPVKPRPRPRNGELLEARRPIAFMRGGIGDYVIALPAVRALAESFGGRLRLVLAKGACEFLFDGLPLAERIPLRFRMMEFDADAALRRVGGSDLFLSLATWESESLVSFRQRLAPAWSIGLVNGHHEVVGDARRRHQADRAFSLVRALAPGKRLEDYAAPPLLAPRHAAAAREIRRSLPPGARVLAVHNESLEDKRWPDERLAEALDRFLARHRDFSALLIGRSADRMRKLAFRDRIYPCHGLPLASSFALVSGADLFLGVDSCMLHVADLARVPSVGIFGPTRAEWWGFRFGAGTALQGEDATASITPSQACAALESRLVRAPRRRSASLTTR